MTSIRSRLPLERISFLDTILAQRWARRLSTRIAKHAHRITGQFGAGGAINDRPGFGSMPTVLGGLEVFVSAGQIGVVSATRRSPNSDEVPRC